MSEADFTLGLCVFLIRLFLFYKKAFAKSDSRVNEPLDGLVHRDCGGATTLSITAILITTPSMTTLLSCFVSYTECRSLFIVMLNLIMQLRVIWDV